MDTEDGQLFVKQLAQYVRTHEKALANALQLRKQQAPKHAPSNSPNGPIGKPENASSTTSPTPSSASSTATSNTIATALSLPSLSFASHGLKTVKLALTPHHLYYLLSRFEDLGISVGPMNVRLENLHSELKSNYVSFLDQSRQPRGPRGSDHGSIHSVNSIRSVMSGMSSLWSSFGLSSTSSAARIEKQQLAILEDVKYLYASFTKLPCLRLAPDRRARLISGFEEFPFDTAVPLYAFKNVSALEISDIDIRQFFGWDRMADQLRSLSVKRAHVNDPADLLINIVLDDMDRRRRRSSKAQISPVSNWAPSMSPRRSPTIPNTEVVKSDISSPGSPESPTNLDDQKQDSELRIRRSGSVDLSTMAKSLRPRSKSPTRPSTSRTTSTHNHVRSSHKMKRSGSGSSSNSDTLYNSRGSGTNLSLSGAGLPYSKWRFLKHLCLSDNGLTFVHPAGLVPLADNLASMDLSVNLFTEIPDSLASLTALKALNLSNCMINSLHSLIRYPLPAISALNLRCNRLKALNGIERLLSLERLDLRDNSLSDPSELARLTSLPELKEIWIEGNPFTKTHTNYRVTIFNLFRRTPGYTEDIVVDSCGPGYREKGHLVERAPEKPNVLVTKPLPPPKDDNDKVFSILQSPSRGPKPPSKDRPSAKPAPSESYTSGSRRKKATKRRIVDLSTTELSPAAATKTSSMPPPSLEKAVAPINGVNGGIDLTSDSSKYMLPPPQQLARQNSPTRLPLIDTSTSPTRQPANALSYDALEDSQPAIQNQDWNVSGEVYRKKIEALRDEVGNGWLSVLSEETWDKDEVKPPTNLTPPDTRPASPRAVDAQISSGRTLG